MQPIRIGPVLAAVLLAAACGDGGDPTGVGPTARVRFFNATTGLTGSGGFTTNGRFAAGSALAFGQSTPTCATVDAGATSIAFGAPNPSGTGLSGNALATLSNQSLAAGGNYTVVATGSAPSPTLFLLDNTASASLGANQAAVRFVNLAPGTATTVNHLNVLAGTIGSGPTTVVGTDIAHGTPTPFATVTSGANAYTILNGHDIALSGSAATLTLQGGTVNTIAIVPNPSGGFQLVNLARCP